MARPQNPLIDELVEVFAAFDQGGSHFLDLPRALVVPDIPEHRPRADFVELPAPADGQLAVDARAFLAESGSATTVPEGASADDVRDIMRKAGLEDAFRAFRRQVSRQRIREWLAEQGVIYT